MLSTLLPPLHLRRTRRTSLHANSRRRTMAPPASLRLQEKAWKAASLPAHQNDEPRVEAASYPVYSPTGSSRQAALGNELLTLPPLLPFPFQSGASARPTDGSATFIWQQQELMHPSPVLPGSSSSRMNWQQQQFLCQPTFASAPAKKLRARKSIPNQ